MCRNDEKRTGSPKQQTGMTQKNEKNAYLNRTSEVSVARAVCIIICVLFLIILVVHVIIAWNDIKIEMISNYVLSALSLVIGGFSLWYIASLKYMRLSLSLVSVWQQRIKELKKPSLSERTLTEEENKLLISFADEIIRYIGQDDDIKNECTRLKEIANNECNRKEAYEKLTTISTLLKQKI